MISSLVFIIVVIVFLALVFAKTKVRGKNLQTRRKSFQKTSLLDNDPNGDLAEVAMTRSIAKACDLDKRRYVVMRNLYIPARNGTTEIDSLLLHQTGIYVFESKNISGEIYGDQESERWRQHLNERTVHSFHNPIHQNQGHIRALQHHLKNHIAAREIRIDELSMTSIIVFSDRCFLKRVPKSTEAFKIILFGQIQPALRKILATRETIFSTQQLETLYWELEQCMNVSDDVKAKHKAYIQQKFKK